MNVTIVFGRHCNRPIECLGAWTSPERAKQDAETYGFSIIAMKTYRVDDFKSGAQPEPL